MTNSYARQKRLHNKALRKLVAKGATTTQGNPCTFSQTKSRATVWVKSGTDADLDKAEMVMLGIEKITVIAEENLHE